MQDRQHDDFNLSELYAALDAQRRGRGISWQQAVHEINGQLETPRVRAISVSTVTSTQNKAVAEGDGVLQMLRWLNRTPESFFPGYTEAAEVAARLPEVGPHQILRFDTRKLYSALDDQRIARGITWKQVAHEIGGLSAASLTHLSNGGRTGFPQVMRIASWLGKPAAFFVRASDW